jgi:predicted aspartyl protease
MKIIAGLLLLGSLPLASISAAHAGVACQPSTQVASLDLGTDRLGRVFVPLEISGHSENMLLQTGLIVSSLSAAKATELGLTLSNLPLREYLFIGGTRVRQYASMDSLQFDHFKLASATLVIMADGRLPPEEAGVIGADVLRDYDLEFDFANGKFKVYPRGRCGGTGAFDPLHEAPLDITGRGQITAEVQLDGKTAKALLDTGMLRSVMGLRTAQKLFGWNDNFAGLKSVAGNSRLSTYTFKSIAFNAVSIANPEIVIQSKADEWPDLILGMDVLRQLHIYIDYSSEKLIVAPAVEDK